jgi:S-adenosylmethionine:tRNA ribosyltransferase-isomerase
MTHLVERPSTSFPGPAAHTAPSPPEARGLARDGVRLLVATPEGITHARFAALTDYLRAGDLLVVNDSATVNGEIDAELVSRGPRVRAVVLHASHRLDDGTRVIELRTAPDAARAVLDAEPGDIVRAGPASLELVRPYPETSSPTGEGNRLWRARVTGPLERLLARKGRPIAYGYLDRRYPLSAYQTVFGVRPGSAEMPSAGRPFTPEMVTGLVARGISVAPVTLHTGLSSQEAGEAPQSEWFEVPAPTARLVNAVRAGNGRVVAVGTTVTRALESAVLRAGDGVRVAACSGWTDRIVTPADPPRVVTALVTGWHDPGASHLLLVEAVAGADLAQAAYDAAVGGGYAWHEFGDSALLLPGRRGETNRE